MPKQKKEKKNKKEKQKIKLSNKNTIIIDNRRITKQRKDKNAKSQMQNGVPYPIYNEAIPRNNPTIINVPQLQPNNNYQIELLKKQNEQQNLLNDLNKKIETQHLPLLEYNQQFQNDLMNQLYNDREERKQILNEFNNNNQMKFSGLNQAINRTNKDLQNKIEEMKNTTNLLSYEKEFNKIHNTMEDIYRNALLIPHSENMQKIKSGIEDIQQNLMSSVPKLENQNNVAIHPMLEDRNEQPLMKEYKNFKNELADKYFNISYDKESKQPIADINIVELSKLPKEVINNVNKGLKKENTYAKQVEYKNLFRQLNNKEPDNKFYEKIKNNDGLLTIEINKIKEKLNPSSPKINKVKVPKTPQEKRPRGRPRKNQKQTLNNEDEAEDVGTF